MQTDDPAMREIGEAIIGNLDDDGQLCGDVEELAAMGPWPIEQVEGDSCRASIRLELRTRPAGMPAASAPASRHGGCAGREIVTDHMRLLQNHQIPELARKLAMSIDDLKQHIELIRHLDPKPGSRYNRHSRSMVSRRVRGEGGRSMRRGAQRRRIAAAAHQPRVPPAARQEREQQRRDAGLARQVPVGALADQVG